PATGLQRGRIQPESCLRLGGSTHRIPCQHAATSGRPQGREGTPANPMISVAALRMQQFGVQFYQASLTAKDIDKLVRFEVLSYSGGTGSRGARGSTRTSKVRWDLLGRRIASSEKAYQRQIIRRKIDGHVAYYEQC